MNEKEKEGVRLEEEVLRVIARLIREEREGRKHRHSHTSYSEAITEPSLLLFSVPFNLPFCLLKMLGISFLRQLLCIRKC